jgi:hypothetical protein
VPRVKSAIDIGERAELDLNWRSERHGPRRTFALMAQKSIIAGAALIVVGVFVSVVSDSGSVTALIPAFIGVVFVVFGAVGRVKPDLNHHLMHAAAALALLAILGSAGSAIGRESTGWALFAQLATILVAGAFLVLAIQSFRAARIAREAATEPA